jgi:hypothetical protein
MHAARRLYLYAMSGVTLAVIAYGLVLLFRVLLRDVFPDPFADSSEGFDNSPEELSLAIAMLGVAGPVWAVHWWLVQRGLREGRPERDEERGAGIRGIYLTGVLLIALLIWVPSAISLLQWVTTNLLHAVPEYTYDDPLGATTSGLAALAIWLYHGLVRRRDLAAGPVSGSAAWVPRLYLYGVAVGALLIALTTFGSIVTSLLVTGDFVGGDVQGDAYRTYFLVQQAITGIAWALVWLGHWTYANRMIHHADWRGVEEQVSRMRVAAFIVVIVAATVGALGDLAAAGSAVMRPLIPDPGFPVSLEINAIAAPLVLAGLWAAAWFVHLRWLRREPAATDPLRASHQERLVSHGVAAVGLAIGAIGAGWLLGYMVDLVVGGTQGVEATAFALAQFVPLAVVGLATWWWSWRGVVARRRADPVGEANSTIRRTFLYLTFGVALIAAIAAAALILYRVVGIVVGAGTGGDLLSELSTPIGALLGAGTVLLYHGLLLRRDQRLTVARVADAPATEPAIDGDLVQAPAPGAGSATPVIAVAPAGGGDAVLVSIRRRALTLVGPEDELEAALLAARAVLPEAVEIVDARA